MIKEGNHEEDAKAELERRRAHEASIAQKWDR